MSRWMLGARSMRTGPATVADMEPAPATVTGGSPSDAAAAATEATAGRVPQCRGRQRVRLLQPPGKFGQRRRRVLRGTGWRRRRIDPNRGRRSVIDNGSISANGGNGTNDRSGGGSGGTVSLTDSALRSGTIMATMAAAVTRLMAVAAGGWSDCHPVWREQLPGFDDPA